MKSSRYRRWIATGIFGIGLCMAAWLAVMAPRPGQAFTLLESPAWAFGPSLVANGQNAVLGVINWGDDAAVVELTIVNAANANTILAQKQITLLPGMGQTITFANVAPNIVNTASAGAGPTDPTAVEISALVAVRSGNNRDDRLRNLSASLEIMDAATLGNRVHIVPTLLPAVQLPAVQ